MDIWAVLNYAIIPICSLVLIPIIRSYVGKVETRLSSLEAETRSKMSENQIRQLLMDKLEPMEGDLKEVKDKLDEIMSYLLTNVYRGNKHD